MGIDWEEWGLWLGKVEDKELAKKIGCSVGVVTNKRNLVGIPRYDKLNWSENDKLLGTMTDGALAEKIGCALSTVRERRRKLGVTRYYKSMSKS